MNSIHLDWPLIVAALFPWACIALGAMITPRFTRPDIFFAVTVQRSFRDSPPGLAIRRQYTLFILVAALVALLPLFCFLLPRAWVLLGVVGPWTIEGAGCCAAFLLARHRTLPHHAEPTSEREVQLAPRPASLPGGRLAQAGPFALLAGAALLLAAKWNQIPSRIPIHWGVAGAPDGWAAKSFFSIFGVLLIGFLTCALVAAIAYGVLRGVRRINGSGRARQGEARFVRAILFFLLATEYWVALLIGLLGLAALRPNLQAPLPQLWLILPCETLLIGAIFWIGYKMGQGGWRAALPGENQAPDANAAPIGDRTPDACWKLGLIYYNPDDPAVLVEKRFGLGWTLNFGNPRSWVVTGALFLFIVVVLLFASLLK
jgi:hypothetical protein